MSQCVCARDYTHTPCVRTVVSGDVDGIARRTKNDLFSSRERCVPYVSAAVVAMGGGESVSVVRCLFAPVAFKQKIVLTFGQASGHSVCVSVCECVCLCVCVCV